MIVITILLTLAVAFLFYREFVVNANYEAEQNARIQTVISNAQSLQRHCESETRKQAVENARLARIIDRNLKLHILHKGD